MITLITLGYILPLIVMFLFCYLSDDVLTVRDLWSWRWIYLMPVVNILMILIYTVGYLIIFIESKIDKTWWNNFLDKRL